MPWLVKTTAAAEHVELARSLRIALLMVLCGLLLLLEPFAPLVFAGLQQVWGGFFDRLSMGYWLQVGSGSGLTTHGLPIALTFRLLYFLLNGSVLTLVLGLRYWRRIALTLAVLFGVGGLLLVIGNAASLSLFSQGGHQAIDLVCSPLALAIAYPLRVLMQASTLKAIR
jgi:hypothetical protein